LQNSTIDRKTASNDQLESQPHNAPAEHNNRLRIMNPEILVLYTQVFVTLFEK